MKKITHETKFIENHDLRKKVLITDKITLFFSPHIKSTDAVMLIKERKKTSFYHLWCQTDES